MSTALGTHVAVNHVLSHPQEKFGWIALPSGSGMLGSLRYEAQNDDFPVENRRFTIEK